MIPLEKNVSTLLHAVLILITVHDLPRVITWFRFSHPIDFGLNLLSPHIFSALHHNSGETCWFSLVMHGSMLTEEIYMQSSFNSRVSMLLPPLFGTERICAPKKNQNPLAHINAFEVFVFRCIVTGPKVCAEAMQLSSIRPARSDGVVRDLMHQFR